MLVVFYSIFQSELDVQYTKRNVNSNEAPGSNAASHVPSSQLDQKD